MKALDVDHLLMLDPPFKDSQGQVAAMDLIPIGSMPTLIGGWAAHYTWRLAGLEHGP